MTTFYTYSVTTPTSSSFNIEIDNAAQTTVILSNLQGKMVGRFFSSDSRYFQIDLSSYNLGIYFYHLIDLKTGLTLGLGKIIKQD